MFRINLSRQAAKFLEKVHSKHGGQIAKKLLALQQHPNPNDSIQLKGNNSNYRRCDVGEYRIIYHIQDETLYIILIAKRNDDDVYKMLKRIN